MSRKERGGWDGWGDRGMVTEMEGMLFVRSLGGGSNNEAPESSYCSLCAGSSGVLGSKFLSELLS